MKTTILAALILGLISLSSFDKESVEYEQIAFNYFISDILGSDFKDISVIGFKGKTETKYSSLGDYKFCLKPQEKLQSIMKDVTKGSRKDIKEIEYQQIKSITITDFKDNAPAPRLYIYPAVRVADNFYVFLSLHKLEKPLAKYVFELNPDGKILRSCRMD